LKGTKSNSHGIGARVRVTAGGKTQIREIHAGSGYLSSPPPEAHFGLGKAKRVDRIEVLWPWGERQEVEPVEANRIIRVEEGGGSEPVIVGRAR